MFTQPKRVQNTYPKVFVFTTCFHVFRLSASWSSNENLWWRVQ